MLTVRLPRQGGFSSLDVECICLPTREDGPRSARCDLNENDPSNHITAQREPPPERQNPHREEGASESKKTLAGVFDISVVWAGRRS